MRLARLGRSPNAGCPTPGPPRRPSFVGAPVGGAIMPTHDEELKRFYKTPREEPDKEFDDSFKLFALRLELKEAINNPKGTKSEKESLKQYIELLENDNKSLDKKRLEAESRVPSLSDGAPRPKPPQSGTRGTETKCKKWLIALMSDDGKPEKTKTAYQTEAQGEFKIGTKAFHRAWANAIEETGNADWSKPGRKA